jgi:hypothetical protein
MTNEPNMLTVTGIKRIKVLTGYAAHARWMSEVGEEMVGEIPRQNVPSPYAYSPTHTVWNWNGKNVIVVETQHRRYEVFEVLGK